MVAVAYGGTGPGCVPLPPDPLMEELAGNAVGAVLMSAITQLLYLVVGGVVGTRVVISSPAMSAELMIMLLHRR